MKNCLKELFAEKGNVSMVRVLSFVCVVNATAIALYGILKGTDLSALSILCGTFLAAGLGAKVAQKSIETKD